MALSGTQIRQLQEALLAAFPTRSVLERLVLFQLDVRLNHIVGGENLKDEVFALLLWADAHNRIEELIRGARVENPGSPPLREVAEALLGSVHPSNAGLQYGGARGSDGSPHLAPADPIDFLVIATHREALWAFQSRLPQLEPVPSGGAEKYQAFRGELPASHSNAPASRIVVMFPPDESALKAAAVIAAALTHWQPGRVLGVGVAGGLRRAGVRLGDVLVAEQVAYYERQKLTRTETRFDWQVQPADPELLAGARRVDPQDWRRRMAVPYPGPGEPVVRFGTLCAGDQVVAQSLLGEHAGVWKALAGVELEAEGVGSAVVPAAGAAGLLQVRGIAELTDPVPGESEAGIWRAYAGDAAAAFALALLESHPVSRSEVVVTRSSMG